VRDGELVTSLIAFPFAVGPDGAVVTVEDGSDLFVEQQLQVIVGTRLGERPMCWPFGIPDPAFDEIQPGDVQAVLDDYGPFGVTVDEVVAEPVPTGPGGTSVVSQVTVRWQWSDGPGGDES
jgi:hypothetical protein